MCNHFWCHMKNLKLHLMCLFLVKNIFSSQNNILLEIVQWLIDLNPRRYVRKGRRRRCSIDHDIRNKVWSISYPRHFYPNPVLPSSIANEIRIMFQVNLVTHPIFSSIPARPSINIWYWFISGGRNNYLHGLSKGKEYNHPKCVVDSFECLGTTPPPLPPPGGGGGGGIYTSMFVQDSHVMNQD